MKQERLHDVARKVVHPVKQSREIGEPVCGDCGRRNGGHGWGALVLVKPCKYDMVKSVQKRL